MWDDEDVLVTTTAYIVIDCKQRRPRRHWVRPSLKRINKHSGADLMADLVCDNIDKLCLEYRSNRPKIKKANASYRQAIPIKEIYGKWRFVLVVGNYILDIPFNYFKVHTRVEIPETDAFCKAKTDSSTPCGSEYRPVPRNVNEWEQIEREFNMRWIFPHCCGSIDGKHVSLQAPSFIVFMAVVDASYNSLFADIGCQGRISDRGIFAATCFCKQLTGNCLNLPHFSPLTGRTLKNPPVFVADDAFLLLNNIMKPFPGQHDKGTKGCIYNYRASRAGRTVENAFGILASVFRFLQKPLLLEPSTASLHVLTFFVKDLHTTRKFDEECNDTHEVIPGIWRRDTEDQTSFPPLRRVTRRSAEAAIVI
ncbi:hypothetical protein PR048_016263 [Dryococelus australis]|uniref:DDE Tnp4 domain-containing protein n=1 Tax=Dryococelus australis TaxID=614101 RepID=A0ABQ9HJU7_9NEOP|nr:hypothetical protein PR048_016263 [Dryococelus australis]